MLLDVLEPELYADFAKLETIELIQGAELNEKPKYDHSEQFMCNVEGQMELKLIPHVFRQEVMGGKESNIFFSDHNDSTTGFDINRLFNFDI